MDDVTRVITRRSSYHHAGFFWRRIAHRWDGLALAGGREGLFVLFIGSVDFLQRALYASR